MYETLLRERKTMKPAPANVCHPILANRVRVSNGLNCATPGLHPNRRRGHAGNRRGSAAYHARSADRSRRVGPGRPAGCPRRTPGEARRRNFGFWLRAGLPRPSKELRGGWIPGCSNSPLKRSPACPTLRNLMENGRPRLETKHGIFDVQFLQASSQGTRPDVGGCLAGAYRHCAHGMLPIRHDFDEWHQVALMAYPRRWVDLSLS